MKKSSVILLLIIALSVIITHYSGDDALMNMMKPGSAASEASVSEAVEESDHSWGNPNTLQDHFKRHGADFDAESPDDYARQAHVFYENRSQYQIKVQDGVSRVYDAETNTFGAYNADGSTRTFYKPTDGQDYFDRQPGK